jgi:hypothetical protein
MSLEGKEAKPMMILARTALILSLMLGATGATAAAAQASAPTDLLYSIKLASEDLRLSLTTEPSEEFELLLGMVEERVEEIQQLVEEDLPVPARVQTRLQKQLEMALQQAAQMDDPALIQALERVQTRTQEHIRLFQQTQVNASENTEDALQLAAQTMANIRIQAQGALEDPTTFRLRLNTERPDDAPEQPLNTPGEGQGSGGNGNSQDCQPSSEGQTDCGPGDTQGERKQRGNGD